MRTRLPGVSLPGEKRQLSHRVPSAVVANVLADWNAAKISLLAASQRLGLSRSRLYELRALWLAQQTSPAKPRVLFSPAPSGGNHRQPWPAVVRAFLEVFLPVCRPLNFALVSDELASRFAFERSRTAVARYAARHWPQLLGTDQTPQPRQRRRWQCAQIGELWQHDSSIHQWWPASARQTLILSVDDHSRCLVAARFVPTDTTWAHFCHFRQAFERHGLPHSIYTDALSLFGPSSTEPELEPRSQFQRALLCLGVNHRVAPDPQAKGKIERLFGHLQNRLVSLFRHEKVRSYQEANLLLQAFLLSHNSRHQVRTTGLTPDASWRKAKREKRSLLQPCPPSTLLDLHLALFSSRRLARDNTIDFLGRSYPVTASAQKNVTIVLHPDQRFWVLPHPPTPAKPAWPQVLAAHSLTQLTPKASRKM